MARDGKCHEAGGEKLEECCKEQGHLAEASEEGFGPKGPVVPMMRMMIFSAHLKLTVICILRSRGIKQIAIIIEAHHSCQTLTKFYPTS